MFLTSAKVVIISNVCVRLLGSKIVIKLYHSYSNKIIFLLVENVQDKGTAIESCKFLATAPSCYKETSVCTLQEHPLTTVGWANYQSLSIH